MSDTRYFLPEGYHENAQLSSESPSGAAVFWRDASKIRETWQVPVYRLVAKIALETGARTVLDIGSGTGAKLITHVAPVVDSTIGVDQPSGTEIAAQRFPQGRWITGDIDTDETWDELASSKPDLIICADVIEHVADPRIMLLRMYSLLRRSEARLIISTPDRRLLEGASPTGPPNNPRHVREWMESEFRLLLENAGLSVQRVWHKRPRAYSITPREITRSCLRLARGRAPLDPECAMVFEVVPTGGDVFSHGRDR